MFSLYHVTERASLDNIQRKGLRSRTCFSTEAFVDYYAEDFSDPIVLRIDLADEEDVNKNFIPDINSVEEPILSCIEGYDTEEDIWDAWEGSSCDALSSLQIVGSVRTNSIIPYSKISDVEEIDDFSPPIP